MECATDGSQAASANAGHAGCASGSAAKVNAEWEFGFCTQNRKAWRSRRLPTKGKRTVREYTTDLQIQGDAVFARWPDLDPVKLDLPVGQYEQMLVADAELLKRKKRSRSLRQSSLTVRRSGSRRRTTVCLVGSSFCGTQPARQTCRSARCLARACRRRTSPSPR